MLHVLAPGAAGGLETMVQALSAAQQASGRPVAIAALVSDDPHPFVESARRRRLEVLPVRTAPRSYLAMWRALRGAMREAGAGIVHTHGYVADVIAGMAARSLRVPTVATAHGFTGGGRRNRLYETLQRAAMARADGVIGVSGPLVSRLAPRAARIWLIRNAWVPASAPLARSEARVALGLPPDGPVIGWVGRLSAEKGPDIFAAALRLRRTDTPSVAIMIGEGRERGVLEGLAAAGGGSTALRLAGLVPDAARYYSAFDVLVLSSRTEGTPIVLFEAMAAGVPIVATRVGGVPDVVGPAEALLVPSEDPAALARAIDDVFGDAAAAARRVSNARARLTADFSESAWVKAHEAVYDSLVAPTRDSNSDRLNG